MINKYTKGLIVILGLLLIYFIYNYFFLKQDVISNEIIIENDVSDTVINNEEILDFKYKSTGEVGGGDTY